MFLRIDLSIDVFFQFIVKISCSKHVVVAFNFSKKDPITRLALSRSLESFSAVLLKTFYTFGNSQKIFCT